MQHKPVYSPTYTPAPCLGVIDQAVSVVIVSRPSGEKNQWERKAEPAKMAWSRGSWSTVAVHRTWDGDSDREQIIAFGKRLHMGRDASKAI